MKYWMPRNGKCKVFFVKLTHTVLVSPSPVMPSDYICSWKYTSSLQPLGECSRRNSCPVEIRLITNNCQLNWQTCVASFPIMSYVHFYTCIANQNTCFSCPWCQFEETHALDCVCPPCSTKYKGSSPNNSHISTKHQQFVEYNSYNFLCESKPYLKGSTKNVSSEPNQAKPSLMSRPHPISRKGSADRSLNLWACGSVEA